MVRDSPSLAQASFPLRELGRQETFSEPSECHRQESSPCQLFRLYCKSHQLQPYCELPRESCVRTLSPASLKFPNFQCSHHIQPDSGLVKEYDLWIVDECSHNSHALTVAGRKSVEFSVKIIRQPQHLQKLIDHFVSKHLRKPIELLEAPEIPAGSNVIIS